MHRATLKAFRTTSTCLSGVRNLPRASRSSRRALYSAASYRPHRQPAANVPLKSSMFFRRLPAALVSSVVVGYGAWYSYNSLNVTGGAQSVARSFTSTQGGSDALPTRTVLVVGADELRQGTIVGEIPISKPTANGRRIVEMLTPDQATEKLRSLEQSFSVNRGQGVTRYDLVQLPSNDPIEDDHAEKIVEVPSRSASAEGGANSDWMFWGVFDGHS